MADTGTNRKNKSGIFFIIIGLLAVLNGFMWYMNMNSTAETEQANTNLAAKEGELGKARADLDSVARQLEVKIAEAAKLGGDTAELNSLRRKLMHDLRIAHGARSGDLAQIKELRQRVEEYEEELSKRDEEIAALKKERDMAFAERQGLKSAIVQREDSLVRMSQNTKALADKVAAASVLRTESVTMAAIDAKGKESTSKSYRAKKVDKVKISIVVGDNKVAKVENKDIYLCIVGPDGSVLSDLSLGGGSFTIDGTELQYTSKQSFLFDNNKPTVVFVWGKGSPMAAGDYRTDVYCEGAKIGSGGFTIK